MTEHYTEEILLLRASHLGATGWYLRDSKDALWEVAAADLPTDVSPNYVYSVPRKRAVRQLHD